MATLNDRVFDNGLTVLDTEANAIHITSAEATTYAAATSTLTLGNSTSLSIGAPQDRTGGGREVVVTLSLAETLVFQIAELAQQRPVCVVDCIELG